jgi:hypothetical protein
VINAILEADGSAPPKQRHTAVRIYHRLRDAFGYQGGPSVVGDDVRAWHRQHAKVFLPVQHGGHGKGTSPTDFDGCMI